MSNIVSFDKYTGCYKVKVGYSYEDILHKLHKYEEIGSIADFRNSSDVIKTMRFNTFSDARTIHRLEDENRTAKTLVADLKPVIAAMFGEVFDKCAVKLYNTKRLSTVMSIDDVYRIVVRKIKSESGLSFVRFVSYASECFDDTFLSVCETCGRVTSLPLVELDGKKVCVSCSDRNRAYVRECNKYLTKEADNVD